MYKIKYYYSSVSKQLFLIIIFFYLLVRLVLFHVGGFSEYYYPVTSTLLNLLGMGLCVFLFIAYKFYYVEFDETKATVYNKLLKKEKNIYLADIKRAVFTKTGIRLYGEYSATPILKIPVYFFGKMSPVGAENFEIMLRNMKVPEVTKQYKVLSGYGRISTFISYIFFFSCIPFLKATVEFAIVIVMIIRAGGVS